MRIRMNLSRRLAVTAAAAAIMTSASWSGALAQDFVAIKSGPQGGTFNRWTSAVSVFLNDLIEGYQFSSEASTGVPENVRAVGTGRAEFALAYASDVHLSYRGEGEYEQAYADQRGLTFLFSTLAHLVVPADSDFETLDDIRGKRVSLGGPGSGSAANITLLLECAGLFEEFDPVYLGSKSPQALQNGEIAGYHWHPGLGNAMVRDTANTMDIRFIDMHGPATDCGFYEQYPYFGNLTIPAGVYPGVESDTQTIGTGTLLTAHADVPADLIYDMLKALDSEEGRSQMAGAVGELAVNAWNEDTAFNFMTVPLHEGAVRFWKEKGADIPEQLMGK